ncbi:glycosyltransferase N-terminal domain-containing protein [Nguyenibacter sp. L1]|uniref:glycosyltransferase N-terminal domain-containing protein n=1 Tax=Nguyenibacter sp. L1 TaxID=3049350 RepID=UPI002B463519|nr:glycosyltransferase N-terminal domain-containing protein [Nguyenibacter sp. L1]WRH87673.1 glycosyltransferase N-terminal domain-containing protein [Nguyenibacter sp. L1]
MLPPGHDTSSRPPMLKRLLAGRPGRAPAFRVLAIAALRSYLGFALRTTRWTFDIHPDAAPLLTGRDGRTALVAFWHETLVLTPALWWWARPQNPSLRLHVLISRNRDGQMITDIVAPWGIAAIAGSTDRKDKSRNGGRKESKGGATALRRLLDCLRAGSLVVITPDGPRGPRRQVQPGLVGLARLSGTPVVPVGAACRARRLGSWDRMLIPLPFGRGRMVCGAPITLTSDDGTAAERIGQAIDAATAAAHALPSARLSRPLLSHAWALLATALAPALTLLLRRRLAIGKERRDRLRERMGFTARPRSPGRLIWLHAASVGESLSILPVIERLAARDPALHVLVTTATVTAAALLDQRSQAAPWGGRVIHQFVPLDVPRWLGRFLRHWRPDAAALTESELWPNLVESCARAAIPIALLNARMSDRAQAGWRRAPALAQRMFGHFAFIAARSESDAARLRALGAGSVDVPGDLKNAAAPLPCDPAGLDRLRRQLAGRPVWLAASTHAGEEEQIAQADQLLRARHPGLLTLIVPRHPERGAEIASRLGNAPRRAAGTPPGPADRFWICDTLGELGLFYRAVPIVFLGNSLPGPGRRGGHNPLEPARLGAALATGPLTGNFADAFARLGAADAVAITPDPAALAGWVDALLSDPTRQDAAARRARDAATIDPDLPDRLAARLLALIAP